MAMFIINSNVSGQNLGIYSGETENDAVEAMDIDAGYESSQAAADALGLTIEQMRADLAVTEVYTSVDLMNERTETVEAMRVECPRCRDRKHLDAFGEGGICQSCHRADDTAAFRAVVKHLAALADDVAVEWAGHAATPQDLAKGLGLSW